MKSSTIGIIVLIVLIAIVGWFVWPAQPSEAPTEDGGASLQVPAPGFENVVDEMVVTPSGEQAEMMQEVVYTAQGFSPNTITIARGTEVTFVNESGEPMWVASNPHPIHTDYSVFDQLKIGGRYTFTFTDPGTYNYHNHTSPRMGGKIIVE